jgi:hypothetical protein
VPDFLFLRFSDVVVGDVPYNRFPMGDPRRGGAAEWDVAWSKDDWNKVFSQIQACGHGHPSVYVFKCHPDDVTMIKNKINETEGMKASPMFWYKTTQNIYGTCKMVPSLEHLVLGLNPKAIANIGELQDKNPLLRHNVLFGPALKRSYCVRDSTDALNTAQSPMYVMAKVASSFVRPGGGSAIDLCAGSGSSCFGLLAGGHNVIGVEKDLQMFDGLTERMVAMHTKCVEMATERKDKSVGAIRTSLKILVEKEGTGWWGVNSYNKEQERKKEHAALEAAKKAEEEKAVAAPAPAAEEEEGEKQLEGGEEVVKAAGAAADVMCGGCNKAYKGQGKCLLCDVPLHAAKACSDAGNDEDGDGRVCKGRACENK